MAKLIKCNICGREIESRSSFAYMTLSNHLNSDHKDSLVSYFVK